MFERYIHQLPLTAPLLGTWPKPRHVPWLRIEWETFRFIGQQPIHWATPARAKVVYFYLSILHLMLTATLQIRHYLHFTVDKGHTQQGMIWLTLNGDLQEKGKRGDNEVKLRVQMKDMLKWLVVGQGRVKKREKLGTRGSTGKQRLGGRSSFVLGLTASSVVSLNFFSCEVWCFFIQLQQN